MTRVGLLSVVEAAPESGSRPRTTKRLMVRARVRRHLELLQRDHPALRRYPIIESDPGRDYKWRIIASRATVARIVAAMVTGIRYANFKSVCAASPDLEAAYVDALHEVWSVFRRLQK